MDSKSEKGFYAGLTVGRAVRMDGDLQVRLVVVNESGISVDVQIPWNAAQDVAVSLWDQAERVRIMIEEAGK